MLEMLEASLERILTEDSDRSLIGRLDELGWDEVMADDAPAALQSLFTIKGRTLSSADALGPRLAETLSDTLGESGLRGAAVVLPVSLHPEQCSARVDGGEFEVRGILLAGPDGDNPIVAPVAGNTAGGDGVKGGGLRLAAVARDGSLTCHAVHGLDPDMGLRSVDARVPSADVTWFDGPSATDAWDAAVAHGRWLLAAELLGVGCHVVESAVAYAGERKQYGRAIGSFQAVQHRLAGAHASVVGASGVMREAASSGSPWVAKVAKALAGRAAEEACTQAQQTYGAIGFTWEHEFHRYLRRTYLLDRLLGDWRTLEHEIGLQLQATREVPRIGRL